MSNEKLELDETLFWENDPPENEDEEPEEGAAPNDEDEDMAPTGDSGPRPIDADGG